MAFGSEVRSINNGIEAARDVLQNLADERLISSVFEDDISGALSKLEEAETEASYIDDQPDTDDVDVDELRRELNRLETSLEETKGALEDAQSYLEDAQSSVGR